MNANLATLGRQVFAIVNYDNLTIAPEAVDAYSEVVADLAGRFYSGVTRYTTSSFLRAKLGASQRRATHLRKLGRSQRAPERAWQPSLTKEPVP